MRERSRINYKFPRCGPWEQQHCSSRSSDEFDKTKKQKENQAANY
jgi:hypothetical protein